MLFVEQYFQSNFILIVLSLVTFLLLIMKPKVESVDFRPIYITLVCIILFTIFDRMETIVTDDPSLYAQRMILSIVCYWLKPAYCLGLLYVIVRDKKRRILILIPEIINVIVMGAACLPGIGRYVFYFDSGFYFQRGPLGYTVFIVGFIYVLILLALLVVQLHGKKEKEIGLMVICAVSIVISSVSEATAYLHNVTSTLVVASCLLYYLVIYTHITSLDELTGLYNRETFNTDSKSGRVSAVASLDMNGLKLINDLAGHIAGDNALASVGKVIASYMTPNSKDYRIGGDEFIILFKNTDEAVIRDICSRIRADVKKAGYSISVGYACSHGETFDEILNISDAKMYEDKEAYHNGIGKEALP